MPPPPHILWIVTTQWRAQATGYAGDPNARTPHLNALAAQSVNYTQAVTPHPFGPFARAALLTGVPSPQNGLRDYFDALPLDTRTIAHELHEHGYHTAFFGKWGVGRRDPSLPLVGEAAAKVIVPPDARGGFAEWYGFEGGFLLNDPWLHGSGPQPEVPQRQSGYQSDHLCDYAAGWLRLRYQAKAKSPRAPERDTAPLFAVVSLEAPHPPYGDPAAGIAPRDPATIILPANVPRGGEAEARARRELAGYYAHIEATDRAIGRLLAAVDHATTVVVFTSVHGDMHGAHGHFRKGWPQEESVRVPLLIRGAEPGAIRRDDTPISLLDLPALTRRWAKGETPESSTSDAPVATAPRAAARPEFSVISMPSVVALPHQCDRIWRGLRARDRKLILDERGSVWLYFDLERDPLEMKNLAGDPARQGEIEALRAQLPPG